MAVNGIDEVPCRFDVVSIENHKVILTGMHLIIQDRKRSGTERMNMA